MSLLIKGINLPEDGKPVVLHIASNGKVYANVVDSGITTEHEAVEVGPHGRLIEADALYEDCVLDQTVDVMASTKRINEYMQLKIDNAKTVIPADPDDEQRKYEAAVEYTQHCELYEPTYDPDTGAL